MPPNNSFQHQDKTVLADTIRFVALHTLHSTMVLTCCPRPFPAIHSVLRPRVPTPSAAPVSVYPDPLYPLRHQRQPILLLEVDTHSDRMSTMITCLCVSHLQLKSFVHCFFERPFLVLRPCRDSCAVEAAILGCCQTSCMTARPRPYCQCCRRPPPLSVESTRQHSLVKQYSEICFIMVARYLLRSAGYWSGSSYQGIQSLHRAYLKYAAPA